MANQIEVTVYQIDGNPVTSHNQTNPIQTGPISISFLTSDIMMMEASISNIPQVKSALVYYQIVNNKLQVQYFYVSETLDELITAANIGGTTQLKVTVLSIDENVQLPKLPDYSFPHYSFPVDNISIWASIDASLGTNSFIEYKQKKYRVIETLSNLITNSNSGSIVGYRGSFYDTTTQSVTSGQVKAMELNTTDTDTTYGFSITNNALSRPTRITASNTGVYNLQFSAQLNRTTGGQPKQIDIWIRVNETDIPNSNTGITMQANDGKIVAAWNFFVKLNAGQYVEIMWTQNDAIDILAEVAGVNYPATPSVIATINQVG